jgi:hypothetical protein
MAESLDVVVDDIDAELAEFMKNSESVRILEDYILRRMDHRTPEEHFGYDPSEKLEPNYFSFTVVNRGPNFDRYANFKIAYVGCTDVTNIDKKCHDYQTGSMQVEFCGWIPKGLAKQAKSL